MIRMSREMIRDLDDARREVEDLPTRPELVRRIIGEWLERRRRSGK